MKKTMLFECPDCGAYGKITLMSTDHNINDITVCPVCAADITNVDEDAEDE
jgi:rubredoxin